MDTIELSNMSIHIMNICTVRWNRILASVGRERCHEVNMMNKECVLITAEEDMKILESIYHRNGGTQ
jgi:hypothetical protein